MSKPRSYADVGIDTLVGWHEQGYTHIAEIPNVGFVPTCEGDAFQMPMSILGIIELLEGIGQQSEKAKERTNG